MNYIENNKSYFLTIALLCVVTYLLNHCTSMYQCALVFSVIAITSNAITSIHGKSKALKGLAFATIISFCLFFKSPYYIHDKTIYGLVMASLISVMISIYWSISIFQKIQSKFSFAKSNFISSSIGGIIDGFIMGTFFVINNNFSYARIADIFMMETLYKITYGFIIFVIVAITLKLSKDNKSFFDNRT